MTSNEESVNAGLLYVVGVPIGHFEDLTLRALRILGEVDLIASEDPAATQRLLAYHGVEAAMTSYGPAHIKEKAAVLVARLLHGARIALVSDCGSPVIADPGHLLVAGAHAHGIRVLSVPGPSALTAAVAAAGLSGDSFSFQGHLPETMSGVRRRVEMWLKSTIPTVTFCPPASLPLAVSTLANLAPRRLIMLACDLTKPGERIIRGTAREVRRRLGDIATAQDITLMLMGKNPVGNKREKKK
jgi:16S rRNA (cytidine1402-2'-O)-methyltransferase